MSIAENIFEQAKNLPEDMQKEILDFALFLKHRKDKQLDAIMDKIIEEDMDALQELAK